MSGSRSTRLVVAPWRSLVSELASDLIPQLRELGRLTSAVEPPLVIIPGGGVARGVEEEIARELGRSSVAPRFLTIERMAERLLSRHEDWAPSADATARAIAMETAAREVGSATLPESSSLSAIAMRSWRDAVDAGVDPWKIGTRMPPESRALFREVEQTWRRYMEILRDAGLRDPADVLRSAVNRIGSERPDGPIAAIYGFYDATGLQTRMLRALLESWDVRALYVPAALIGDQLAPDYAFAERLIHDLGFALSDAVTAVQEPSTIAMRPALTPTGQQESVCDQLADRIARGASAANLAVVSRTLSAADIEMWRVAAGSRGLQFASRNARPLMSFRAGRVLRLLLDVRNHEFQRSDVMELIESGLRPLREARRQAPYIDSHTRAKRIASGGSALLQARFGETDSEAIQLYIQAVQTVETTLTAGMVETAPARDWSALLAGWLKAVQVFTDDDIRCIDRAERWITGLAFFGSTRISREEIARSLETLEVESGTSEGIFVGDVMQARGRRFDAIFFVDALEGTLPQGRVQDPLLRDEVRERVGMRTIGSGDAEEQMLFRGLLDSAAQVSLSWPETEVSGRPTRPSPLVTRLAAAMYPGDTAAILGDLPTWLRGRGIAPVPVTRRSSLMASRLLRGESRDISPAALLSISALRSIGTRGRWDGYLLDSEGLREQLVSRLEAISPTALEHYGTCPQKFLVRGVLGIDEIDEPEDLLELETRDKGTVLHRILESFYRRLGPQRLAQWSRDRKQLSDELHALLDDAVTEEFRRYESENPARFPRMREFERRDALRTLEEFLVVDLSELAASGFVPTYFEFSFGEVRGKPANAPAVDFDIGQVRLHVRGSIDRVDLHPDGRVRIVDYKRSGGPFKDFSGKVARGESLQLAMYCHAWSVLHGTPAERISAQILALRNPKGPPRRDDLVIEYAETAPRLEKTLTLFASGILAGWFPALPGRHCHYCPVGTGCRVRNDAEASLELADVAGAGAYLWPGEVWD